MIALLANVALASGETRVNGRVSSDTNAPVANAAVTLTTEAGDRYRAFTEPTGDFNIVVREPGTYGIAVDLTGFFPLKDRIAISGVEFQFKLMLNPLRELAESVDVNSASSAVELDKTTSEKKLTGANLLDIPYPTTNSVRNAMRILPGIVQDSVGGIHVNGGAEDQVQYLLDGFNVTDPV